MSKFVYDTSGLEDKLGAMASRENIRRIVEAGSKAAILALQERTQEKRHVYTGEMERSITAKELHEDLGSAWQYVYPGAGGQDRDTVKAYVINYGRGGKRTAKTGDKFITGNKKQLDEAVKAAMAAEADRILNETMR
jgi:hypothetical protein